MHDWINNASYNKLLLSKTKQPSGLNLFGSMRAVFRSSIIEIGMPLQCLTNIFCWFVRETVPPVSTESGCSQNIH